MTAESKARPNPFPGLRPFSTEEHHLFFGREEQTAALLSLFESRRFLAVVGTSGSGKSSLVRAGLIPALHRGSMARAGTSWEVVVMRPGGNPIASLARALLDVGLYDAADPETLPSLAATLGRSLYGLVEAVRQSRSLDRDSKLFIVVDQFEELFRFRQQGRIPQAAAAGGTIDPEEAASAFVRLLLAAAVEEQGRIYVCITMRSDYLGDCAQIPGLAEAVNRGEYLIPRLTRDQRRDAIEKPVGVAGARISGRLVQEMLNDMGDDPDQLPVLQHALLRTFDAWSADHRPAEPLDLRHYDSTGGMAEALSRHADEIFAALPDERHRHAAERLFKALTMKGVDNRGIRRPGRLGRLSKIAAESEAASAAVVEAYRQPGVTFLMPGAATDLSAETVIDLSHESLMRVWRRLRGWVEEEAQSARVFRRLSETAALWTEGKAGLYHDPDLHIARSWRDAVRPNAEWAGQYGGGFESAMAFLEKSRDEAEADERAREQARQRELSQAKRLAEAEGRRLIIEKRARKRLRWFTAGLAGVAALAVAALGVAIVARHQAVSSANLATSKELAATQAAAETERVARELQETIVQSDFHQGADLLDAGEGAEGLAHLARAMRTDPGFWQAGVRAMTALASGRFPLRAIQPLEQDKVMMSILFNPVEDLLLTSDYTEENDRPERLVWDARSGKRLYSLSPKLKRLQMPGWTSDGQWLVARELETGAIHTWAARSGKESTPIVSEELIQIQVGAHPGEGTIILGLHRDGSLRAWKLDGKLLGGPILHSPPLESTTLSPDSRTILGIDENGTLCCWDAASGSPAGEFIISPYRISVNDEKGGALLFTPDSQSILCVADGGKAATWWKLGAGEKPADWVTFEEPVSIGYLPASTSRAVKVVFYSHAVKPQPTRLRASVYDLATRKRTALIETQRAMGWVDLPYLPGSPELRFPLLTAIDGNGMVVWDLETGELIRDIRTSELLARIGISPEGRRIWCTGVSGRLMLFDLFSRSRLIPELPFEGDSRIRFSRDGEKLIINNTGGGVVQVLDSRSGKQLTEPIHMSNLKGMFTMEGDNRWILEENSTTTRGDNFIKKTSGRMLLLDAPRRPAIFEALLEKGSPSQNCARFTPEGDGIVGCGKLQPSDPFSRLFIWEYPARRLRKAAPLPEGISATEPAFQLSPDGRRALVGCTDRLTRIMDLRTGEQVQALPHPLNPTLAVISPDSARAAIAAQDGNLVIWDLASGRPLGQPVDSGAQEFLSVRFSADGNLIAAGSTDMKVRLIDGHTGELRREMLLDGLVTSIVFSPKGHQVIGVPFSSTIFVIEEGAEIGARKLDPGNWNRSAELAPGGKLLAVGMGNNPLNPTGGVQLWDWREARKVGRSFETHGAVEKLEFSRDGSVLATGTGLQTGGLAQLWDVASGRPLIDPVAGQSRILTLSLHPGGTALIAVWQDGMTRLIEVPPPVARLPEWLPALVEAVAGLKLAGRGGLEAVPGDALAKVQAGIAALDPSSNHPYERWARWLFSDAGDRAISPGSSRTFREHLAALRKSNKVEDLQTALRMAPSDAVALERMGLVLLESMPSAAAALDPNPAADRALRQHWRSTADWYSQEGVLLEPGNAGAWALRAEFLRRLGRAAESAAAVSKAETLVASSAGPADPNVLYMKALRLAGDGNWEEAGRAFEKALENLSDAPQREAGAVSHLGVLARLEPAPATERVRDVRLPEPIPGTFENFETVPEGGIPARWSIEHEDTRSPGDARSSARLDSSFSDVFEDWTVVSRERASQYFRTLYFAEHLLSPVAQGRLNGAAVPILLDGRFLYSVSATRDCSQVQRISTPDFDCSDRSGVHVAFQNAYQQADTATVSLEYSIDGGNSWLPVLHRFPAPFAVQDAAGKLDAGATLENTIWSVPLFIDAEGKPRGIACGEYIEAGRGSMPQEALEPMPANVPALGKRIEVYRLPRADGRSKVRLRFTHAGRLGWYWAIDNFGLHEIPEAAPAASTPPSLDRTLDPYFLAALGVRSLLGFPPGPELELPLDRAPALFDSTPGDAPLEVDVSPAAAERRLLDARLLLNRAEALAPEDPMVLLAVAVLNARGGAPDRAIEAVRKYLARRPASRQSAAPLAAVYLAQGDALKAAGDGASAGVLQELAYVLTRSAGIAIPKVIERLSAAGLLGESTMLIQRGSEWKFQDDGRDLEAGWKDPGFDDRRWNRGKARLGYGKDGEVTQVDFGPDSQHKFIATYFRAEFQAGEPGRFTQLRLRVQRDDGIAIYLNGREVVRDNLPSGDIGKSTLALNTMNNADEKRFFEFEIPSAALQAGRNVLAAQVHQQSADSSDMGFDLELEGLGAIRQADRTLAEMHAIEERQAIPADLRGALWVSRAGRARQAGDLQRAAEYLDFAGTLAPGSPAVPHERALLQLARGEAEAAFESYRKAVEGAVDLKNHPLSSAWLFLPESLKVNIEPILHIHGVSLAAAAERMATAFSLTRDVETRWLAQWSRLLDADGHAARRLRFEALFRLGAKEEALKISEDALASAPGAGAPPAEIRQHKQWQGLRERFLRAVGRTEEADRMKDAILLAPPRNPRLPARYIDLSAYYNGSIYDERSWHDGALLRYLPETYRPRDGIGFDIRGLIQLNSAVLSTSEYKGNDVNQLAHKSFPYVVSGIPVGLETRGMHFLLGGIYTFDSPGVELGRVVIHFEDGGQADVPLKNAQDIIDWKSFHNEKIASDRVAWVGYRPFTVLTMKSWTNPDPHRKIKAFDLISSKRNGGVFLLAATAE